MPRISGYEVLCRLKSDPRHCELPVIMISALDEIDSVVRCIEVGAEDYMPKPFDPVLLRARINSCLERKRLRDREKVIHAGTPQGEGEVGGPAPQRPAEADRGALAARRERQSPIAFPTPLFCSPTSSASPGCRRGFSAARLVELLNLLFTDFDRLTIIRPREDQDDRRCLYGRRRPARRPIGNHVAAVADMSLAMLDSVRQASRDLDEPLQIRIGIHTRSRRRRHHRHAQVHLRHLG